MKKLVSKIFVTLAIIGMVTFIAPKKAMAESGVQYPCVFLVCCGIGTDCTYVLCTEFLDCAWAYYLLCGIESTLLNNEV